MSQVYSIKCPNCGAPLSLIGGGRVQTITCAYCQSVIDLNDNYKVLAKFKNVFIPKSPFKVGMQGKINGVEWTIIGWIVYRDSEDSSDRWSEFLLFSPLYGYAWLVYEDGVISFSRRVRDLDLRKWQRNHSQPLFFRQSHYTLVEEKYYSIIDFVQGELNYIAKQGDKISCWDYNGVKGQSISIEKSNNELEVYYTQKLDAQTVYDNFKVKKSEQNIKKPTIQEEFKDELEDKKPLSYYGIVAIFIALLIAIFSSLSNDKVLSQKVNSSTELLFRITNSAFLTKIELNSINNKTLNSYAIKIYKQNKKIFYIDKDSVYFAKHVLGNSWSKRAKGADIYIKLDTGQYLMEVEKISTTQNPINITVEQKVIRLLYILPIFILILLFLIYSHFFINSSSKVVWIMGILSILALLGIYTNIAILPIIFILAIYLYFLKRSSK